MPLNDQITTLAQIRTIINEFRQKRGWKNEDPKDAAISLALEAAEVLEHFQWISGEEVMKNPKIKAAIGEEISDVVWWIVTLSDRLGIDVAAAFEDKVQKNAKKWPEELFDSNLSFEERKQNYYRIKAAARGGHPLYDPDDDDEEDES